MRVEVGGIEGLYWELGTTGEMVQTLESSNLLQGDNGKKNESGSDEGAAHSSACWGANPQRQVVPCRRRREGAIALVPCPSVELFIHMARAFLPRQPP